MLNVCGSFHILLNLSSSTCKDERNLCAKLMSAAYSFIAERNLAVFFPQYGTENYIMYYPIHTHPYKEMTKVPFGNSNGAPKVKCLFAWSWLLFSPVLAELLIVIFFALFCFVCLFYNRLTFFLSSLSYYWTTVCMGFVQVGCEAVCVLRGFWSLVVQA